MSDSEIFPFKPDMTFDLFSVDDDELEKLGQGAYVLLRTQQGQFEYPAGGSRIFYIGESGRGVSRLATHRYHASEAQRQIPQPGPFTSYWWPRYGFAAAFGAEVWWFNAGEVHNPKGLESLLIDRFYWSKGAIPIANGKWPNAPFSDPDDDG